MKIISKIRDFLNNRYVYYIVVDTFLAVFTWSLYAIFYKTEYLSFQGEGLTYLFMLLWIFYPCAFSMYESKKKNRNKKK